MSSPDTFKRKLLCPDCRGSCTCRGRKLKHRHFQDTDWYGRLRWFKCGCCKTTYVSQGGSSLMVAAIQL